MNDKNKIFNLLENIPKTSKDEIFETLVLNENVKIERIISYGQTTPKDYWYDQDQDEFVLVIEGNAKILFDNGTIYNLHKNDSLNIKAHQKHQVMYTANLTVWLAVFTIN